MICKEELCALFKNLSPYKRIDYMCSLLHMCHPLEIRFIGSVLEEYGRKDYYYLRDNEIKANTPNEVSRLTELPEEEISAGLNVYLCLLHSSNLACSKLIFEILDTCLRRAFDFSKSTNPKEHEKLLLALTLAVHHPAFTFYQKTILYECYAKLELQIRDLEKHDRQDSEGTGFTEDCEQICSNEQVTTNKVVLTSIDIRDIKKRSERKAEFKIQVTWSNNDQFEITKTPRELQDFQMKLQKLFPTEVNVHGRGWKIPFLHGNTYYTNRDERENPKYTLQQYFSHIFELPQHVLESEFVIRFFGGSHSVKVADDVANNSSQIISHLQSPLEPATGRFPLKSMTVSNSQLSDLMPDESVTKISKCNNQHTCQPTSKGSPHWLKRQEPNRHICSKRALTTTQHRSPAYSPMSSSTDSPSSSRPSSPVSHKSIASVTQLLKLLNLEKYSSSLSKYSVEQLASMTSEELSEEGLSKDSQQLLLSKLETITRSKSFASKNGVVELCHPARVISQSTNLVWHTPPPGPGLQYPPLASPAVPCQMLYITSPGSEIGSHCMVPGSGPLSDLTNQDLSSECSSTPPSPGQGNTKQQINGESSGSEDNDKDKVDQDDVVGRRKDLTPGQTIMSPGVIRQEDLKMTPTIHPTFYLEPKPQIPPLLPGQNAFQTDSVHAPVMSTGHPPIRPTYFAVRPYKAPKNVSMSQEGQMKTSAQSVPHVMNPLQPGRSDYPTNVGPASVSNNTMKTSAENLHRSQPVLMGRPVKSSNSGPGWSGTSTSTTTIQSAYHSRLSPGPASAPPLQVNPNGGLMLPAQSASPSDSSLQGMPGLPANCQSVANTTTTRSVMSQSPGPAQPPNSSSSTCDCICGSCDCQNSYPPTSGYPQYTFPPTAIWPWQIPPQLIAQGNGIIAQVPPNIYGQIPPANFPNGLNLEYPFQHHPNLQYLSPGVLPMYYGCNMLHSSVNKQRNQGCYNCGGTNHKVQDCKEKTMESLSGFHLNYIPKSDSE